MRIVQTSLNGVFLLEPQIFTDERGFFVETWNQSRLKGTALGGTFVQDNHSRSTEGVVRGLHYQLHRPQGKLVHVARGRIFDVAVDVRRGSPQFGKWFGAELSDENLHSLWIPPGFAHGFCVLSPVADVIYKCTTPYDAADDRGVVWNDPGIRIEWPCRAPLISEKDASWARLNENRDDLPAFA